MTTKPKVSDYSLADEGELRDWMGTGDTAVDAAVLIEVIEGVSRWVESACGRHFLSREHEHDGTTLPRLNGTGCDVLVVAHRPITAVSLLIPYVGGPQLVQGTDFDVDAHAGIVRLVSGVFSSRPASVSMTWTGGFLVAPDDVILGDPMSLEFGWQERAGDLRLAVLKLMAEMYYRRTRQRDGVVSRTTPAGETIQFVATEFLPDVKACLERYGLGTPSVG